MAAQTENQGPGQDSFLDIVANLVGILIILVVVVGAQAGENVLRSRAENNDRLFEQTKAKLESATKKYNEAIKAQRRVELLSDAENRNSYLHNQRRNQLLIKIEETRRQKSEAMSAIDVETRKAIEITETTARLKNQLASIENQINTIKKTVKPNSETIEHIPTPIAKTVFNDEVHFRLLDGKVVHVPLERLIELMRSEWEIKAQTLQPDSNSVEMVGPIEGFRMKYLLESFSRNLKTPYGPVDQQIKQMNRFIIVPDHQDLGTNLNEALKEGSAFSQRIARLAPRKHTISIWVYPDSFAEYNRLKKWFYQRGFQIACWPIPQDQPISGGPNGSRSIAQ